MMDVTPWTYEPSGDVDGDPAYDGRAGIDHFVMEGDEEIGCFRDEVTARLISAAPALLAACRRMAEALSIHHMGGREPFPGDQRYAEAHQGLYDAIARAVS